MSLYQKLQVSAAVEPPIALQLAKAALSLATGRLSTFIELGIDKLATPEKFKQWEKGTTANLSSGVLSGFKKAAGYAIEKGKESIESHLSWEAPKQEGGPSAETRINFFDQLAMGLQQSINERKDHLVDIERALLPLNTPDTAGLAAELLDLLALVFRQEAKRALDEQALESMRHWARFVSHASLGSIDAGKAEDHGLKPARDGTPTANLQPALLGSGPYAGLLDIEFEADILHPEKQVTITGARLFGLHSASVKLLKLDALPLVTAGLPIRLKSSTASSPLAVTITRDEAGNIAFLDESGALGMQTPWLSRRGGGRDDAAAYRAAKELMEKVQSKTFTQLGVEPKLDHA